MICPFENTPRGADQRLAPSLFPATQAGVDAVGFPAEIRIVLDNIQGQGEMGFGQLWREMRLGAGHHRRTKTAFVLGRSARPDAQGQGRKGVLRGKIGYGIVRAGQGAHPHGAFLKNSTGQQGSAQGLAQTRQIARGVKICGVFDGQMRHGAVSVGVMVGLATE